MGDLSLFRYLVIFSGVGLTAPFISKIFEGTSPIAEWLIDLATHWQWFYLAGLTFSCAILAFKNSRWAFCLLAAPLPWITSLGQIETTTGNQFPQSDSLTVASVNLHYKNHNIKPLQNWIEEQEIDVLVLHELSYEYAAKLNTLRRYPYRVIEPSDDPFGIAILSRFPLQRVYDSDGKHDQAYLTSKINWNGHDVNLIALHAMPPISSTFHQSRNRLLHIVAEEYDKHKTPTIVAGDFNATPWSNAFKSIEKSGLKLATGLSPTWPAFAGQSLGIPIDHILVSHHWNGLLNRKEDSELGSDHRRPPGFQ